MMNTDPNLYFINGCGRCPKGGTPECKVHKWEKELAALRTIVLDCGLTEESKWGVPCYTYKGSNILIIHSFRDYCAYNFFKGALLTDSEGILVQQTENVQATRQIRFTDVNDILKLETELKAYIYEAVEIEKAGLEIEYKKTADYEMPDELLNIMEKDPEFKLAFESLTPGRQRGYLLHFAQPKQSKTRIARIEKYMPTIFEGKGMHDDYRMNKK